MSNKARNESNIALEAVVEIDIFDEPLLAGSKKIKRDFKRIRKDTYYSASKND